MDQFESVLASFQVWALEHERLVGFGIRVRGSKRGRFLDNLLRFRVPVHRVPVHRVQSGDEPGPLLQLHDLEGAGSVLAPGPAPPLRPLVGGGIIAADTPFRSSAAASRRVTLQVCAVRWRWPVALRTSVSLSDSMTADCRGAALYMYAGHYFIDLLPPEGPGRRIVEEVNCWICMSCPTDPSC